MLRLSLSVFPGQGTTAGVIQKVVVLSEWLIRAADCDADVSEGVLSVGKKSADAKSLYFLLFF